MSPPISTPTNWVKLAQLSFLVFTIAYVAVSLCRVRLHQGL